MLLNLTDLSDESLQSQIARQIREKILADELAAGAGLPSIRALARQQHVSVITVQRAYEFLMRQNLIHSRRGKGFFISDIPATEKRQLAKRRLSRSIEAAIRSSRAEGLNNREIMSVVESLLNHDSNQS